MTGWKIDIKSESKMEKISTEILDIFKGLPYIGDVTSRVLYNEGFRSLKEVAEVDPEELAKVLEIEKEKAVEIVTRALSDCSKPEENRRETKSEETASREKSGLGSCGADGGSGGEDG